MFGAAMGVLLRLWHAQRWLGAAAGVLPVTGHPRPGQGRGPTWRPRSAPASTSASRCWTTCSPAPASPARPGVSARLSSKWCNAYSAAHQENRILDSAMSCVFCLFVFVFENFALNFRTVRSRSTKLGFGYAPRKKSFLVQVNFLFDTEFNS